MSDKAAPQSSWPADVERILLTEKQIQARVAELAAQLQRDYAGRQPLLVGVLTGAFVFLADLLRHLPMDLAVDFIQVSSYGDSTQSSRQVKVVKDLTRPVEGKHVVVVEDIVDTGHSLKFILETLSQRGAASIRCCVLLDKPSRREVQVPLDYVGFEIPDHFVVGYGLDFAQRYRNLPYVAVLRPEAYKHSLSEGSDDR